MNEHFSEEDQWMANLHVKNTHHYIVLGHPNQTYNRIQSYIARIKVM